MTTPGGHGNDINLAALWVPVMPETSHIGEEMRKAGGEAKRQFDQGFNTGASPEEMGRGFASKFTSSLGREFSNFELPFGGSRWLERLGEEADQKLISKLKGQATEALKTYRAEYDNLSAAQGRAAEAESRLNVARENGINKASIMLPLMTEHQAAQKNLTDAQTSAASALNAYTQKTGELHEAQGAAADSGKMLAGIMGGLVVEGANLAVGAVEHLVEGIAEGFKEAIEITKELAVQTVELGETYEHIGIQVHEFSSATGEDFEKLESAAQQVFSTLDVAGNDTGKTMAQLSSMLDLSGESISGLVHDVVELQGRFTNLRSADLGAIFVAFKTPADQLDSSLASMLESARGAGQGLGDLVSALSGNAAITLAEAGLNLEQASAFTAKLMEQGAPGRQAMTGMAMAMKDFGNEGLSFADGMKLAGERLQELGDTAEGQDLAEKLFGGRNWTVAMAAVQDYLDVVNQGPDAFHANADATHDFLTETETLGNKVEQFKHQVQQAFQPLGTAAKDLVVSGLNLVSTWFTEHRQGIVADIKRWGDEFIDNLPKIQAFAADSIQLLGTFAAGALELFQPVAQTLAVAGAGFLALSGHFKDAKDLLVSVNSFDPGKIKTTTDDISQKIRDFKFDSEEIKTHWDAIADRMAEIPATLGSSAFQQGSAFNPTGGGGPGGILAGPGAIGPGGGGRVPGGITVSPDAGGTANQSAVYQAMIDSGFPPSQWDSIKNIVAGEDASWDPNATNTTDSNAAAGNPSRGIGQLTLSNYRAAGVDPNTNDPYQQGLAMMRYIAGRYGTPDAAWQHWQIGRNYQTGGFVGPSAVSDRARGLAGGGTGLDFWIMQAAQAAGVDPAHWNPADPRMPGMKTLVARESSNNPLNINTWDSNAKKGTPSIGLAQVIGPTAAQFGIDPRELTEPVPNLTAAMRYIIGQYGDISQVQQANPLLPPKGYAAGGMALGYVSPTPKPPPPPHGEDDFCSIMAQLNGPDNIPDWCPKTLHRAMGGPSGTDTVPAWLTPGEYVWDTETVNKFGGLISMLHHAKGFQGGGPVDDTAAGVDPQLQFIAQIAQGFGLTLGSGFRDPNGPAIAGVSAASSLHGSGEAQDFGSKGQEDQMLAFATYVFEHFGSELAELIHDDPRWKHNVKDGRDVGPMGQVYKTEQAGDHTDHVHVGIRKSTSIYDQLSPGNEPLSAGIPGLGGSGGPVSLSGPGSTPGGTRGASFPGMAGQYGGLGAYGGQTADEAASTANAVQEAKDRKEDLDHAVEKAEQRVKDLNEEIAKTGQPTKTGALGLPVKLTPDELAAADEKRKTLNEQLDEATHQLSVARREAGEQTGKISEAERKQQESFYKKPSGTTGSKDRKAPGESEFSQLGTSLLGGIGQELGFGDLFSKPPWEWGAVKLLTGAASWAIGTANAWAEQIGQGKTGIGGPGWGNNSGIAAPGWNDKSGNGLLSGLSGSFGLNLPNISSGSNVSDGPNVVPGQPDVAAGQGSGPPPGPMIQGDYMPINVTAGIDPKQVLAPMHEYRNSAAAAAHTFTGGMP